jgi:hypothetical protein
MSSTSGGMTLWQPGDSVSVHLTADSNGEVAQHNHGVELTGEGDDHPTAALTSAAGNGIGRITEMPEEYDENASYSAGEVVGVASISINGRVEWLPRSDDWEPGTTGTQDPAVGDDVVFDTGGTVKGHETEDETAVIGRVWTTVARDYGQLGNVAVLRYR